MTLHIAIRTDASVAIGTGHVMRCLTLAQALRADGHAVTFIMRDLPGNMCARIKAEGFELCRLPAPAPGYQPETGPSHAHWAGVSQQTDSAETAQALRSRHWDWLILDHYAFDADWQRRTKPLGARLMVIDDLADRPHACDLLLDQNLGRRASDYIGLVDIGVRRLIGPAFALIRPQFNSLRAKALAKKHDGLHHVLIAMGGIDAPDVTSTLLQSLPRHLDVTVVMGAAAPALAQVRVLAADRSARLFVDTPDMAQLMLEADLAIGGVGGSAWERCALGLPTLMVVMADNQHRAAAALAATGAARLIGQAGDADLHARLRAQITALSSGNDLAQMAAQAAALCDGRGVQRVASVLNNGLELR